jgi:3-oxoacyl-[acyl-carrier protein] reductase
MVSNMLLHGKQAVLTGCNGGIGLATLRLLVENGADVWACVRTPNDQFIDVIEKIVAETGFNIKPVYFDLNSPEQVKAGAKKILEEKIPIDILINNAGSICTSPALLTPVNKIEEMLTVNFTSQILFTQYISRNMVKHRSGSVINIASSAGIEGNEGRLAYASSKAAMISATKVLARELGQYNIRVNAIAPGLTDTEMMTSSTDKEAIVETLNRVIMRRVAVPSEIGSVVVFLASDLSSYMTGQIVRVDGGM